MVAFDPMPEIDSANGEVVLVRWVDSAMPPSGRWGVADEQVPEICTCDSVGFLRHFDDNAVTLTPHIIDETDTVIGQTAGQVTIPRRAIISVTRLMVNSSRAASVQPIALSSTQARSRR